jgi:hypothetical protein
MDRNFYRITKLTLLALLLQASILGARSESLIGDDHASTTAALPSPQVPEIYVEETDIDMFVYDPTEDAYTEIYRSTSPTSGFVLIHTEAPNPNMDGFNFADHDLKPRTTYYYRLRSVRGSETSPFFQLSETTYSNTYLPTITTRAINPYTIEITLVDNSYNDESYEIMRTGDENDDFRYFNEMVTLADSGRSVKLIDYPVEPGKTYEYFIIMYTCCDQEEPQFTAGQITMPRDQSCSATGSIEREKWTGIPGYGVSLIPVYTEASNVTTLTSFSAPANNGDNYGVRIRGFVCPPTTGDYVFYISSDDNSELWLSTDELNDNKRLIASSKWTAYNQWDKYTTQQSVPIRLEAGKKYFIEALHKENAGADHLSVGWKLPNGTLERPIPGNRLSKYPRQNYAPRVQITSPQYQQVFNAPANVKIAANVFDPDGTIALVEFYNAETNALLGTDNSAPYEFQWNNLPAGNYTVLVKAKDNQGLYGWNGQSFEVRNPTTCSATGKITREIWNYISGSDPSVIPLNAPPHKVETYTTFETIQRAGDNYGSRMRGYVCVPVTGNYTFWISSDDRSMLYLSTDDDPANKRQIASVTGYTGFRVYDKYATQKSAPISLVAGRRYYIEAIHKEALGNDFISVGWQLPNGTLERPIPASRLIDVGPIAMNKNPTVQITSPADGANFPTAPANVKVTANASDPDGTIKHVTFYLNDQLYNTDTQAPFEYTFQNLAAGSYQIHAFAYDNSNTQSLWSRITITVGNTDVTCAGSGKIYWEVWGNAPGSTVADIPIGEREPNQFIELNSFETPQYYGNEYGARIRGYICPPRTGAYIFYIASDDASELWLSTNDNPANKRKIAYLLTAVQPRTWITSRPGQQSAQIHLTAGTKYYIEALHKEAAGNDHVAVAWRFVLDGSFEGPIPGSRLIPFSSPNTTSASMASSSRMGEVEMLMSEEESNEISLFPNPTSSRQITVSLGNLEPFVNPRVEIISSAGQVVQAAIVDCDGCNSIDFTLDNDVVPGLYMVNVVLNRRRVTKKLRVK